MKAITLWQPWASLIAWGYKTIETRRHGRFAGLVGERIAIHAGKGTARYALTIAGGYVNFSTHMIDTLLNTRGIVCTAIVLEHRRLTDADSVAALCPARGLYGLILDDVERFDEPVVVRGHQGVWIWNNRGVV